MVWEGLGTDCGFVAALRVCGFALRLACVYGFAFVWCFGVGGLSLVCVVWLDCCAVGFGDLLWNLPWCGVGII